MTLAEFVGASGLIFGLAGFVLGVMNYLRDRAKIVVELQWDMKVTPGGPYDPTKSYGVVRVTNIGRRAIYISHASLRLPKGYDHPYLLLADGIPGKKLCEGDSPETYAITQEGLAKYVSFLNLSASGFSGSLPRPGASLFRVYGITMPSARGLARRRGRRARACAPPGAVISRRPIPGYPPQRAVVPRRRLALGACAARRLGPSMTI